MLEMTANEVFRFLIWITLLVFLIAVITIGVMTMVVKNQTQHAADLLSSTGGYMKTTSQQRQWWNLTHNNWVRITDVHFDKSDFSAEELRNGSRYWKINRGVPVGEIPSQKTSWETYTGSEDRGFYESGKISTNGDLTFDEIERRASAMPGGVALNGPTGVQVNQNVVGDNEKTRLNHGYMSLPGRYGNRIVFTVRSRFPVHFFRGRDKKGEAVINAKQEMMNFAMEYSTASLRGHDTLSKASQADVALAEAQDSAKAIVSAACAGSGSQYIGFGTIGVGLNQTAQPYFAASTETLRQSVLDKIDKTENMTDLVNLLHDTLNSINAQTGKGYADPNSGAVTAYTNENGVANSQLVFRGLNGQLYNVNNFPWNNPDVWPNHDALD